MKTTLLREIQRVIREEPKRMQMENWLMTGLSGNPYPACGTVGCIAGWACILSRSNKPESYATVALKFSGKNLEFLGADALGLSSLQARRLFMPYDREFGGLCWPRNLWRSYEKTKAPKRSAEIVCKRIDLFIKTKGRK